MLVGKITCCGRCVAIIAGVIPGQNTDDSARAVIVDTPEWAEWKARKMSVCRFGVITIVSLYIMTPSIVYRCLLN